MTSVADLELDLDVFQGPFDLLLAVLLREEVSLADVSLSEIVVSYIDHLDRAGRLDLDTATEFLVLIAALLELKSRMMLPGADEDGADLTPEQAADELLARMLEYRRYSRAAAAFTQIHTDQQIYLYRSVAPPVELRRAALADIKQAYDPERLSAAVGDLLAAPPEPDVGHIRSVVSVQRRLGVVLELLRTRPVLDFDESFGKEDRFTQAVTLFALLELHRRGEASWNQTKNFGPIEVRAR